MRYGKERTGNGIHICLMKTKEDLEGFRLDTAKMKKVKNIYYMRQEKVLAPSEWLKNIKNNPGAIRGFFTVFYSLRILKLCVIIII